MTVGQLVRILSEYPQQAEVLVAIGEEDYARIECIDPQIDRDDDASAVFLCIRGLECEPPHFDPLFQEDEGQ